MYEQLSIFDYINILDSNNDKQHWTILEPQKNHFILPKTNGTERWRKIECQVFYPKVNKKVVELYEYKDFTFRSIKKWDPKMGNSEILAWREIEAV
ncbi:hypothetical protein [Candidatus Merdisoma sp. JLR.KK006]|uniref:hypothetical protein n=1 Tax=Candidatus Merdisoma sp. JLR.KK006 TaxID=3112626 RepID=UPI002FEFF172